MQLGYGARKGAIREMVAGVAPCERVLPVAESLPTKAFAETVVIRAHEFFELHFIRAWHAQAAQAVIHFGPFRSGHPPTEIATRGTGEWMAPGARLLASAVAHARHCRRIPPSGRQQESGVLAQDRGKYLVSASCTPSTTSLASGLGTPGLAGQPDTGHLPS